MRFTILSIVAFASTALAQGTWQVDFFTSGCQDDPISTFSGNPGQTFSCLGGFGMDFHNVRTTNLEANNLKVVLYTNPGCQGDSIGEVTRDGTCYAVGADTVGDGYAIVTK